MFGALRDVTPGDLLRFRFPRCTVWGLLAAVLSLGPLVHSTSAQYCTPDQCDECNLCRCSQRCCHSLPELWLVNTRCAPRCKNLDCGFERLIYKRYDRECRRWVRESRESFLAQESTMPTMFFVHGNSLNHKNAMKQCWQIYCKMRCCPGPKRLVYWSWPAERVYKTKGLRVREMIEKNLRIKYVYSEYQSYYLAKLVNMMSLSQRVMMAGHSYGAITASGAAHFIGGGCLRGLTLEGGAAVERPNLRVGAISGAFDHDMLNPGNRYGQTFVAAEKVYVTRNIKDRTLKKWPKTSWRCKKAIGVLGVNANRLGVYRNKLCQQTMTDDVGTSHYLTPHLKSVKFVAALCCLSFPQHDTLSPVPSMNSPIPTEASLPSEDFDLDLELLSDEQLDDDGSLVEEDELVVEEPFAFHDAELDPAFMEGMSRSEFQLNSRRQTTVAGLSPLDSAMVLASARSVERRPSPPPLDDAAMVVDWNAPMHGNQPMTSAHLMSSEAEEDLAAMGPTEQPQLNMTAETVEPSPTTEGTGYQLWYQCGLGLAIVLSGQFYVLFSKRVPSS